MRMCVAFKYIMAKQTTCDEIENVGRKRENKLGLPFFKENVEFLLALDLNIYVFVQSMSVFEQESK